MLEPSNLCWFMIFWSEQPAKSVQSVSLLSRDSVYRRKHVRNLMRG